jgi:hypothetical protein
MKVLSQRCWITRQWSYGNTLPGDTAPFFLGPLARNFIVSGFWCLICYADTQLAIQLHQERIQVVRSNWLARNRPAELNGTPAMDLGFENICKRKHTNKRGINKTHIHKHATCRNSTYTKKELMLHCILLLTVVFVFFIVFGMNSDDCHVVDLVG